MKKKAVAMLLAAAMAITSLVGCGLGHKRTNAVLNIFVFTCESIYDIATLTGEARKLLEEVRNRTRIIRSSVFTVIDTNFVLSGVAFDCIF